MGMRHLVLSQLPVAITTHLERKGLELEVLVHGSIALGVVVEEWVRVWRQAEEASRNLEDHNPDLKTSHQAPCLRVPLSPNNTNL